MSKSESKPEDWRSKIFKIIYHADTPAGKWFDILLIIAIAVSVFIIILDSVVHLNLKYGNYFRVLEWGFTGIFTLEYILRVVCIRRPEKYIFSFFGIVDLFSILPFYLASGLDLRAVRMLRLIRLIRILKMARYNAAMKRFQIAFSIAKEELSLFLFATLSMFYLSGVGIYYFENEAQPEAFGSVFHSLWWSVATLTTVGYGDVYPITVGGRVFTFVILVIGLGIVSIPAGLIASALSKAREME